MKIVLFGPPGAGKGTQAVEISRLYNIPHVSTGALLRKNIEAKTEIGLAALEYIERGKLAPDELVIRLLMQEVDLEKGFLLDGFPRTLPQAEMLDGVTDIDVVLDICLDDETITDRIVNRLVCPACGKNYNKRLHSGFTCTCGATLTKRSDDTEEIVRERLSVYAAQTKPLIGYYESKNKLVAVDGNGTVEEVFDRIKKALNDYHKD